MMQMRLAAEHFTREPRIGARKRGSRAIVLERVLQLTPPLVKDGRIQLIVRIHSRCVSNER
jgi:hypothetical protein